MIDYKAPSDVCKEAKEYMKTVLARLEESGVLENVDVAALDMLARNYSMFINIVKHPAVTIAKDAQIQAVKIMQEFGLTAKSRTKLPKLDKEKEEDSPLEKFVKTAKEVR